MKRTFIWMGLVGVCATSSATAQTVDPPFQLGVQVAGLTSGEFDKTDAGVSGRFSWQPVPLVGAEAEVAYFPKSFTDDPALESSRVEGLFGVTVGPRVGQVRPFAKARAGFVTFRETSVPGACIAVVPPPLACTLAAGKTVPAFDLGGGLEVYPTTRTFLRFDLSDRMLRYPGPVTDTDGALKSDDFFGHDFRFAVGAGVRF
jgi:hypothetical protein